MSKSKNKTQRSEKTLKPEKITISNKIRSWAEDYHVGRFVLEGHNPLMEKALWFRYNRVCVTEGKSIIVRKPNKIGKYDNFLVGKLDDIEHDILEDKGSPFLNAKVTYLNREFEEAFDEELTKNKPEDYVIGGNNEKWTPEMQDNEDQYKVLDYIYRAGIADLIGSRSRFAIKSRKELKDSVRQKIQSEWDSWSPVVFYSADDEAEALEGTLQLSPESRANNLKIKWDNEYSLFRRLNNIKHNTSKKEDRQNNPEIKLTEDQFENLENPCIQAKIEFLTECYKKFDGEKLGHYYKLIVDGKQVFEIGDPNAQTTSKEKVDSEKN